MKHRITILTDLQKATLELYLYSHKDFGLVFEFLEKIGVDKNEYQDIFKQLKHE
jgi:hypothetical protein